MFQFYWMAAILNLWVRMMSYHQTDVRIEILMVNLAEKVSSNMIVGALVQKLIFQEGAGGHLGFRPLAKIAGIFARDLGAKIFLKGL
jgi:hypothetical protein